LSQKVAVDSLAFLFSLFLYVLSLYSSSCLPPFFLDSPAVDRPLQPGRNRATRRCRTMKTLDSSSRHPLMMHRWMHTNEKLITHINSLLKLTSPMYESKNY